MKNSIKAVLMVMLAVPLAFAQQSRVVRDGGSWAEELSGSLASARNVRVKVDAGSVRVVGGAQSDIRYSFRGRSHDSSEQSARKEFEAYKVNAYVRGDTAWVVAEWQGGRHHKFSAEFVVEVPKNSEWVKVETDAGEVSAKGIDGKVNVESGGGVIRLDEIGGAVSAETGGGNIEVGSAMSDVRLRTGGGNISIRSAKGKIDAESGGGSVVLVSGLQGAVLQTGGGSIHVDHCTGEVKATTAGGSIDLGDIVGNAQVETGGGSIRLTSAKGQVRAQTGGGSIDLSEISSARAETGGGGIVAKFVSANGDHSDSVLETGVGDITVYLAADLNLNIRASIEAANGHTVHSDFSEIHVTSEGDWGPKAVIAEGKLNNGGPLLKIITSTGDIYLRRASR